MENEAYFRFTYALDKRPKKTINNTDIIIRYTC